MTSDYILSSGFRIKQNIKDCVRFVFFETDVEGWEYATHGGSAFLINYKGKIYGLTCKHVFGDFARHTMAITNRKFGDRVAAYNAVFYPSEPKAMAVDTDILDVALIRFSDDCQNSFFLDDPFIIDEGTIDTSGDNDLVVIEGTLKDKSEITEKKIVAQYCCLEMVDSSNHSEDPTLKLATAQFSKDIEFENVVGISGSPVFKKSSHKLCGMVVRGGLKSSECRVYYIDIYDILQFVEAVHTGEAEAFYRKEIKIPNEQ